MNIKRCSQSFSSKREKVGASGGGRAREMMEDRLELDLARGGSRVHVPSKDKSMVSSRRITTALLFGKENILHNNKQGY